MLIFIALRDCTILISTQVLDIFDLFRAFIPLLECYPHLLMNDMRFLINSSWNRSKKLIIKLGWWNTKMKNFHKLQSPSLTIRCSILIRPIR